MRFPAPRVSRGPKITDFHCFQPLERRRNRRNHGFRVIPYELLSPDVIFALQITSYHHPCMIVNIPQDMLLLATRPCNPTLHQPTAPSTMLSRINHITFQCYVHRTHHMMWPVAKTRDATYVSTTYSTVSNTLLLTQPVCATNSNTDAVFHSPQGHTRIVQQQPAAPPSAACPPDSSGPHPPWSHHSKRGGFSETCEAHAAREYAPSISTKRAHGPRRVLLCRLQKCFRGDHVNVPRGWHVILGENDGI